jgi:cation:H+ antiporter
MLAEVVGLNLSGRLSWWGCTVEWLLLVTSLFIVTLGAEALVRGASTLALRMGVSPLFVGLTIVGFGTSSPELAASLVATARGSNDVSVGNVVGSNIFNIGVIVAIAALIRPITIQLRAVRRDLFVAVAAAAAPWSSLAFGATLPGAMGALYLSILVAYLALAYGAARRASYADGQLIKEALRDNVTIARAAMPFLEKPWVNLAMLIGGLGLLVAGSRVFVGAALNLGRAVGISELVLGLTIVSGGTSLPELVTSIVAAARHKPDIAVGNVIGSNIFNVFGILGVCAIVRTQTMTRHVLTIDLPVMLVATLALVPLIRSRGVITRREGMLLLVGYTVYLVVLGIRGG